jgi:hypothetical protein
MKKSTLLLLFAVTLRLGVAAQTFTENIQITCGDTAYVGDLGYPTWSIPEITRYPEYGHAILLGDFIPANLLQYQAPFYFNGTDTVVIKCAKATQITCDTGIYVFHVGCSTTYEPVYPVQVACNDTVRIFGLNGFAVPQIVQVPLHGKATIYPGPTDAAMLEYIPEPGFEGLDNVLVSLFINQDTVNYLFQVYCNGVVGTAGVQEIRAVQFYPQPATSTVFCAGIYGDISVATATDMSGRSQTIKLESGKAGLVLDISGLVPGVYFVQIADKTGKTWIGKLVKASR